MRKQGELEDMPGFQGRDCNNGLPSFWSVGGFAWNAPLLIATPSTYGLV
jgi:hypothetical protein